MASRQQDAKRPVLAIAGPYGHPFHPILVPVPIGAWVASLVFDLASRWSGEPGAFARGAWWLVLIGIVGALLAALLGTLDLLAIPTGTRAFRLGLLHMGLNAAAVTLFAFSLPLRRGSLEQAGPVGWGVIALSLVALGTLAVAGWLGGMLAYRYGVRVADEATQAEGFR